MDVAHMVRTDIVHMPGRIVTRGLLCLMALFSTPPTTAQDSGQSLDQAASDPTALLLSISRRFSRCLMSGLVTDGRRACPIDCELRA